MTTTTSESAQPSYIPIIDVGPLRDNSDPEKVAQELHRASREVGFIYVQNHGLDESAAETVRNTGLEFFHLPEIKKREVVMQSTHRGFIPIGGSKMYDDAQPDLKETFVWGFEPVHEHAQSLLRSFNIWPVFMPELKRVVWPYFEAVNELAVDLMRGFAIGLGLAEDAFIKTSDFPVSRGSLVFYPSQSANVNQDQHGVSAHTDFGLLTVLNQDEVGGLQVQALDGSWIDAPPIPGTLVINVGDLLARWTNDRYRSTPHRVVNTSGRERLSLVVAYDPNFETRIDPAMICGKEEPPKYQPIRCGDYLNWRFNKSFKYSK